MLLGVEQRLAQLSVDRMAGCPGLDTIRALLAALDNPHKRVRTIHVAGTNGKGSVCLKLAASLGNVGLYTSPHIATFHERIRVGLRPITPDMAREGLAVVFRAADRCNLSPSYFEFMTALAFWQFARQRLELAVIETGLGGRLDATNVITPMASVITSIGYDHCDRLGDTLEQIAREKAGIIKPDVPVVLGPMAAGLGIDATHVVKGPFDDYRQENRAIAQATLDLLQLPYDPAGLDQEMPCRFQRIQHPFPMILDAAHNVSALQRLLQNIRAHHPDQPITVILGCSSGRDPALLLALLQDVARVHLVDTRHPRVLPVADLLPLAIGLSLGICGPLRQVLAELTEEPPFGTTVCCGTQFIMEYFV